MTVDLAHPLIVREYGKIFLVNPLLFGLTVVFAACDERGRQPGIGDPSPSIHKLQRSNTLMRDSDLENAVRAKIENDAQLKEANLSVNADAVRNEVTLSGTVRTHAARKKAIELAKSAKPGVAVNDKLDAKPGA